MATQEIIVRDWLWYVYPMLFLFAGVAVFFGVWAYQAVRVCYGIGAVKAAAQAAGIATRSIVVFIAFKAILRVVLFCCALFVLWIFIGDTLTGFIRLERTPTTLHLRYHLGSQDAEIPISTIETLNVRPFGKRSHQLVITTRDGRVVHSVSTDSDAVISDFRHVIIFQN